MIAFHEKSRIFHVATESTSYVMGLYPSGQLGHLYYGPKLAPELPLDYLLSAIPGVGWSGPEFASTTNYSTDTGNFSLHRAPLEYGCSGKGDYRTPSIMLKGSNGDVTADFVYLRHEVRPGAMDLPGLPSAVNEGNSDPKEGIETLVITLRDAHLGVELDLMYTPFSDTDCITRSVAVRNVGAAGGITITKLHSASFDTAGSDFSLLTLNGAWIRERHHHLRTLGPGTTQVESRLGVSSSLHSPFIALARDGATETRGDIYAVALVYSGSHECGVHISTHDDTRMFAGLHSEEYEWRLESGEEFFSPQAVLTYSAEGFRGMSRRLHDFVGNHIVRGPWKHRDRPVLINNWEATYFDFNEAKLLKIARAAQKLGIELFVLDDGWFGKRDDDSSGLGDWVVNTKKLPRGIEGLAKKIADLGMSFGLWFEPEMISMDSDLYRSHPEYLVRVPEREPSPGRKQFVLDLTNPSVQKLVYDAVARVLESGGIHYVKWDMNRNLSDAYSPTLGVDRQKEFHHRYVLGLYAVLERLVTAFPEVLFESCASGGNRFDLGMLCYMPQTWTSDNTDAWERVPIQYGTSMFAPPSTMGAHVSAIPNHQVLRNSSLESRFNTAAFGVLGYELDVTKLSNAERKIVTAQIEFYKTHRRLLQYGRFYRLQDPNSGEAAWCVVADDDSEALVGYYQKTAKPNPAPSRIPMPETLKDDGSYSITNKTQYIDIRFFGDLVNRVLPMKLKINGLLYNVAADNYLHELEKTTYAAVPGALLKRVGLHMKPQFYGTGEGEELAVIGDFGSRIFHIREERA